MKIFNRDLFRAKPNLTEKIITSGTYTLNTLVTFYNKSDVTYNVQRQSDNVNNFTHAPYQTKTYIKISATTLTGFNPSSLDFNTHWRLVNSTQSGITYDNGVGWDLTYVVAPTWGNNLSENKFHESTAVQGFKYLHYQLFGSDAARVAASAGFAGTSSAITIEAFDNANNPIPVTTGTDYIEIPYVVGNRIRITYANVPTSYTVYGAHFRIVRAGAFTGSVNMNFKIGSFSSIATTPNGFVGFIINLFKGATLVQSGAPNLTFEGIVTTADASTTIIRLYDLHIFAHEGLSSQGDYEYNRIKRNSYVNGYNGITQKIYKNVMTATASVTNEGKFWDSDLIGRLEGFELANDGGYTDGEFLVNGVSKAWQSTKPFNFDGSVNEFFYPRATTVPVCMRFFKHVYFTGIIGADFFQYSQSNPYGDNAIFAYLQLSGDGTCVIGNNFGINSTNVSGTGTALNNIVAGYDLDNFIIKSTINVGKRAVFITNQRTSIFKRLTFASGAILNLLKETLNNTQQKYITLEECIITSLSSDNIQAETTNFHRLTFKNTIIKAMSFADSFKRFFYGILNSYIKDYDFDSNATYTNLASATYSNLQSVFLQGGTIQSGNISLAPAFNNESINDFTVKADSPHFRKASDYGNIAFAKRGLPVYAVSNGNEIAVWNQPFAVGIASESDWITLPFLALLSEFHFIGREELNPNMASIDGVGVFTPDALHDAPSDEGLKTGRVGFYVKLRLRNDTETNWLFVESHTPIHVDTNGKTQFDLVIDGGQLDTDGLLPLWAHYGAVKAIKYKLFFPQNIPTWRGITAVCHHRKLQKFRINRTGTKEITYRNARLTGGGDSTLTISDVSAPPAFYETDTDYTLSQEVPFSFSDEQQIIVDLYETDGITLYKSDISISTQ